MIRSTVCVATIAACLCSLRLCESFRPAHPVVSSSSALSAVSSSSSVAHVALVSGSGQSGYGQTSPEPDPSWQQVSDQLALRLPHFAGTLSDGGGSDVIQTTSIKATELGAADLKGQDIVVALGGDYLVEGDPNWACKACQSRWRAWPFSWPDDALVAADERRRMRVSSRPGFSGAGHGGGGGRGGTVDNLTDWRHSQWGC